MTGESEGQIAALRREIRRAGAVTAIVRGSVHLAVHAARWLAGPVLLGAVAVYVYAPTADAVPISIPLLAPIFWLAVIAWLAIPAGAAYRSVCQRQLRRKLTRMPSGDMATVLLSLKDSGFPDTRQLVNSLIRDLRPGGTEPLPADAPTGRGDEPTP
jgi:hypothetical protein